MLGTCVWLQYELDLLRSYT